LENLADAIRGQGVVLLGREDALGQARTIEALYRAAETGEALSSSTGRSAMIGGNEMDDAQIHSSIEQLVAEEHELWEREAAGAATDEDRRRLASLKLSLDQFWDLLRQRRALRESGGDPDAAHVRPPEVVEGYEQ
jgi:hypothetical protein